MSTAGTRTPMVEFIEDALGLALTTWQREMVRRFYLDHIEPERAAQAGALADIDEIGRRADERISDALRFQGRTSRRGSWYQFPDEIIVSAAPGTRRTRRELPGGGTRTHITTTDREWIIDEQGEQSA